MNSISVIIPTYKNIDLLVRNLKKNQFILKDCEVIVVNDDPTESISKHLRHFVNVKLIENKENRGFGGAVNAGVQKATHRYILLLNTDVVLTSSIVLDAISRFQEDASLFAVGFAQKDENKIVGKNRLFWHRGLIHHSQATQLKSGKTAWAEGGTSLIDKKKFIGLGGFDSIYKPFYWEDIDLSYRAWKAGFKVQFEQELAAWHPHESTIGKYFQKSKIKRIAFRNQFLFIWKNIDSPKLLFSHIFFLPINLTYYAARGEFSFILGFFMALSKLAIIFAKRNKSSVSVLRTDQQILDLFHD